MKRLTNRAGVLSTKSWELQLHDIADMRLALEGAFETAGGHARQPVSVAQPTWRRPLAVAAATAIVAVLVSGLAAWSLWPAASPLPVTRFAHDLPEAQRFRATGRPVMALSPDGQHFVYNTLDGLYLRTMGTLDARLILGTEAMLVSPFFSPDGQAIAYWQDGELKRLNLSGGAAVVICAAANPFGASWSQSDMIFLGQPEGVMRVSANGGRPELVVKTNEGEQVHGPQLLPDGDSLLFSVTRARGSARWDQAEIVVQSLRGGERKVLLQGGSDAHYVSSGHLIYAVGDTLFAVAFDPNRLEVNGRAVSLLQGMMRVGVPAVTTATANYGLSDNGTLVYVTDTSAGALISGTLVWVDRNGKAEPLSDRQARYRGPRVSPDGARVAVAMLNREGNEDIWVVEAERRTYSRLTSDPASDYHPLWTPDGTRIVFSSNRAFPVALYSIAADGSGVAEPLTKATAAQAATSFLQSSMTFAFQAGADIFTMTPGESPVRHSETPFREQGPVFSPDGRWLAYTSDETGQPEIYITPYPGSGGRIAISTGGGHSPRWSPNGRELFYRNGRQMMVVAAEPSPTFRAGTPRVLFEGDYLDEPVVPVTHNYDVSRDGQRFLMVAPATGQLTEQPQSRIVVVENWTEELKRLVPVN